MRHLSIRSAIRTGGCVALVLVAGILVGCGADSDHDKNGHDDHGHDEAGHEGEGPSEHGDEDLVRLDESKWKEFGITVEPASSGQLHISVELAGEVAINEDRLAHVVPRVAGVVREVKRRLGDHVSAGEVLAVLDSSELAEVRLAYLTSLQRLATADLELGREKTIYENTRLMIELLDKSPNLDDLAPLESLDLGENRSRLVSAYAERSHSEVTFMREAELKKSAASSEADYRGAQSAFQKAHAEYRSIRDEISFQTNRNMLESQRSFSAAEFEVEAARRRLLIYGVGEEELSALAASGAAGTDLARHVITAPIAGRIIAKHVVLGEAVVGDLDAFTIADLEKLWVNLRAYQKDIPFLALGLPVVIHDRMADTQAQGSITYLSATVDEETRTALVQCEIDNAGEKWRPGVFVTGDVQIEEIAAKILVPKTATFEWEGNLCVFVKTEEGFATTPVALGRTTASEVEVIDGLRPGDEYVTSGTFTLKSELAKAGFEAGHAH